MTPIAFKRASCAAWLSIALAAAGCGGGGDKGGATAPANSSDVVIVEHGPNAVSTWSEIAINTINVPASATGTAAEQRPIDSVDLASVHLAIYDALMVISGSYKPFYAASASSARVGESSQPAAVAAAALGVLKGLYPARSSQYQGAYDTYIAAIAEDDAKARGLATGAEVAAVVLAARADDGRSVVLTPYVPGTAPGRFRGQNPVNRFLPAMKPFTLTSVSQFRPPAPPALDSAAYATDLDETRALGGTVSSVRTAAQLEIGQFHTEPPFRFWPRNLRRFATTDRSLADHARLMAMLFVAQADATMACFEAKYVYEFWRPTSAITLAETDGNPLTTADPAWTPVVPTPNHPEYPAAHACASASVAAMLRAFYGTDAIKFKFDSTVTGSTHHFTTTQAFVEEVRGARIYGGMHFRNSLVRGEELGEKVAQWVNGRHFQKN
ncbi:vanadium-dependent haloperoxidase [Variovorax sp. J22R133]|uniref:vanadium-dependent haloperoxidase n=1 Tax=Variovorax brevis TaxID=3053503 RepID=UPI002574FED7|nr:vanadium-dependent haloperoxidase [Variovorax sp. J22R133]MDM0116638.1 vanadium-dependent haloperoxidase [Variovorax sp. J22R133]